MIPYNGKYTNHPTNGLLLRADIHTLFDLGLIAVDTATMQIIIAPALSQTSVRDLAGAEDRGAKAKALRPNPEALDEHRKQAGL